jgi:hypothetical protein
LEFNPSEEGDWDSMLQDVDDFKHWRGCVISEEMLGLAQGDVQVNDEVVLVSGLGYPLVLRAAEGGCWKFIGRVVIDKIMEGEAWRDGENFEGFVLC